MTFTRLPWRIGLPFAAFVVIGSVFLVAWTWWSIESEERASFERLARTNAEFIRHMRLPASERLAQQLGEVLGVEVSFRTKDGLIPSPGGPASSASVRELERLPPDSHFHLIAGRESVAVPLDDRADLVVTKPLVVLPRALLHPRTLAVLGAFWFAALLFAWLITRRLVKPLHNLAAKLPDIEKPEAMELPEVRRNDEIGDVARAFVRTREALREERQQRERAEKLAVLGRMTAALAHEIQNPVAAIKMHAQLMQADVIEGEAAHIEGLVNQWMFLSKPEPPEMSDVDLGRLLEDSVKAQRARMDHAQVRPLLKVEAAPVVRGDRRRLAQVFSNLIINAIQAMPSGGELVISATKTADAADVSFADQGRGFSESALNHFAEFFYSEKEGGMGIGLSVANEIVKAHGGSLRAENRREGGARVIVRLALSRA